MELRKSGSRSKEVMFFKSETVLPVLIRSLFLFRYLSESILMSFSKDSKIPGYSVEVGVESGVVCAPKEEKKHSPIRAVLSFFLKYRFSENRSDVFNLKILSCFY